MKQRRVPENKRTVMSIAEELGWNILGNKRKRNVINRARALTLGSMELYRQVAEHRSLIPVRDAATWEEFRNNAKQAYKVGHKAVYPLVACPKPVRGRPPEENIIMRRILELEKELGRDAKYTEIVTWLLEGVQPSERVSKNTADKYAKLYRLYKQFTDKFSEKDKQWLCNTYGEESFGLWWWFERACNWSGVSDELPKYLKLTSNQRRKERKRLETLRLRLTYGGA